MCSRLAGTGAHVIALLILLLAPWWDKKRIMAMTLADTRLPRYLQPKTPFQKAFETVQDADTTDASSDEDSDEPQDRPDDDDDDMPQDAHADVNDNLSDVNPDGEDSMDVSDTTFHSFVDTSLDSFMSFPDESANESMDFEDDSSPMELYQHKTSWGEFSFEQPIL